MPNLTVAIDIGSTRLKAALLDAAGNILSLVQQASPLAVASVHPAEVMAAAGAAAREACAGSRPDAIAVTGATRTTVLVREDGRAIGAAIALTDGRGSAHAGELQQAYPSRSPLGLGAFHLLARVMDVRDNDPAAYREMRWAMELKDWINLQLTGQSLVDSVALARIQPVDGDTEALLARLQLKPGLTGGASQAGSAIGVVREQAPPEWHWCQGVAVVQCGFDAWCASFGMGTVRVGAVYNVCGTTDVFGSFLSDPVDVEGIACLPWSQGVAHLGGPCLTGLSTLAWFGQQFLGDPDPAGVIACAAEAGYDCPVAMPFVHGERMPFWRADLRARFLDVHAGHGRPEFARALIDGLLLFQRWLVGRLAAAPDAIYLGGGGAALPGWPQAKASAFGVPVRIATSDEPALLGAAMCTQVALGRFASLAQSQDALCPGYREVAPDERMAHRLRSIAPRFLAHLDTMLAE